MFALDAFANLSAKARRLALRWRHLRLRMTMNFACLGDDGAARRFPGFHAPESSIILPYQPGARGAELFLEKEPADGNKKKSGGCVAILCSFCLFPFAHDLFRLIGKQRERRTRSISPSSNEVCRYFHHFASGFHNATNRAPREHWSTTVPSLVHTAARRFIPERRQRPGFH